MTETGKRHRFARRQMAKARANRNATRERIAKREIPETKPRTVVVRSRGWDERALRALGHHFGKERCTLRDVRTWAEATIDAAFDEIQAEHDADMENV